MAPELLNPTTLDLQTFPQSPASDAYAFAMVVIEVFTGKKRFCKFKSKPDQDFSGHIPFAEIRNTKKVTQTVLKGARPDRPKNAESLGLTDDVWDIVRTCWQKDPDSRFGAFKLVECLEKAVSAFSQTHEQLGMGDQS
jgi:hypothetical protein